LDSNVIALYPNLYVFLVAHPGVGKTRTVRAVKRYFTELPEPHIAPTSVTASSLVDALVKAKRTLIRIPEGPLEYNSLLIAADELTALCISTTMNDRSPQCLL